MSEQGNVLMVEYAGKSVAFADLPPISQAKLVRGGQNHFFGNEQAAKVTAFFNDDECELEDNDANRAAKKAEYIDAAWQALIDGKGGIASRGPAVDPVEAEMRRLARIELETEWKPKGLALPKGENTIDVPGLGKLTRAEIITRRVERHKDRYRKDAEKRVKAAKAAAEKAKAAAEKAKDAPMDAESLGI